MPLFNDRSLLVLYVVVGLFGSAWAAFAFDSSPVLTCNPARASHAGVYVKITEADDLTFLGELSQGGMTPTEPFEKSEFLIQRDSQTERGQCALKISKKGDDGSLGLKLRVWPGVNPGMHDGKLEMNRNGQPLHENFRPVFCYMAPGAYEEYCPQNHGGTVYQHTAPEERVQTRGN